MSTLSIFRELQECTTIDQVVRANFCSRHEENLIVCKVNVLEVYAVVPQVRLQCRPWQSVRACVTAVVFMTCLDGLCSLPPGICSCAYEDDSLCMGMWFA